MPYYRDGKLPTGIDIASHLTAVALNSWHWRIKLDVKLIMQVGSDLRGTPCTRLGMRLTRDSFLDMMNAEGAPAGSLVGGTSRT
jgi:hypothetical protein